MKLLGSGNTHPKVYDFIEDYFACATGSRAPSSRIEHKKVRKYMAHHAGLTGKV